MKHLVVENAGLNFIRLSLEQRWHFIIVTVFFMVLSFKCCLFQAQQYRYTFSCIITILVSWLWVSHSKFPQLLTTLTCLPPYSTAWNFGLTQTSVSRLPLLLLSTSRQCLDLSQFPSSSSRTQPSLVHVHSSCSVHSFSSVYHVHFITVK